MSAYDYFSTEPYQPSYDSPTTTPTGRRSTMNRNALSTGETINPSQVLGTDIFQPIPGVIPTGGGAPGQSMYGGGPQPAPIVPMPPSKATSLKDSAQQSAPGQGMFAPGTFSNTPENQELFAQHGLVWDGTGWVEGSMPLDPVTGPGIPFGALVPTPENIAKWEESGYRWNPETGTLDPISTEDAPIDAPQLHARDQAYFDALTAGWKRDLDTTLGSYQFTLDDWMHGYDLAVARHDEYEALRRGDLTTREGMDYRRNAHHSLSARDDAATLYDMHWKELEREMADRAGEETESLRAMLARYDPETGRLPQQARDDYEWALYNLGYTDYPPDELPDNWEEGANTLRWIAEETQRRRNQGITGPLMGIPGL